MDQNKLLAQAASPLGRIGGEGLGPFGNINLGGSPKDAATVALVAITKVISNIIGVMTIAAGIFFLFQILIAGINWISAEGDAKKLAAAQQRITNALLGLLIVITGMIVLAMASKFLGYDLLITKPGEFIERLGLP